MGMNERHPNRSTNNDKPPTTNYKVVGQIPSDSSVVISKSLVVGRERKSGFLDDGKNDELPTINEQRLWDLKKHELEEAIGNLSLVMRKKYSKKKETKYGSINKGFTDEELGLFLAACRNEKGRLAFTVMAMLGLRVGEVVKIR
jgi:hypothetical protein